VTFGLLLCQRRPSDGRGQRSRTKQERFAAQLGNVLEYVERLQAVDVSGVEPLGFAGDATAPLPLREDEPQPCLPREKVLSQAPEQNGEAFLVPRILE